jgi:trehalose/maltose hydrolase-like predicted phosphorylase
MAWSLYVALLSLASCLVRATVYETRFNGTTWDDDNWRISTTDLVQGEYQYRMSLANGYLGIALAALGPFFEVDTPVAGDNINGWPLFDRRQTFATVAGFYDRQDRTNGTNFEWLYQYDTGESVISGVPHWAGLHLQIGNEILGAGVPSDQITNFNSTLDLKHGVMYWDYTWTPHGGSPVKIEYEMLVHKLYVNQAAVQLKVTPTEDLAASVIDILDGDCAVRTTFVEKHYEPVASIIWSGVQPNGVDNVTAYVFSLLEGDDSLDFSSRTNYTVQSVIGGNSSSIGQTAKVALKAGKTSTFTKYIGAASSDAFEDPKATALLATIKAGNEGFDGMMQSHSHEWESILTEESVDSYRLSNGSLPDNTDIQELQIIAVTNAYHLLQNTVGTNAILKADNNTKLDVNSISVGGLGSDSYAG